MTNTQPPPQNDTELSGDISLSLGDRGRYLWRNFVRNLRTPNPITLTVTRFDTQDIDDRSFEAKPSSPSRALTDAFLQHQLPQLISKKNITVLDIGCGSGRLSDDLAAQGYHGDYTGVDLGDRFRKDVRYPEAFVRHSIQDSAHNLTDEKKYDLIVSVSALEHIHDDEALISRLSSLLNENGLGVHFIPSGWGLPVYLWHGYRQYTLGDIEQKFGRDKTRIYALGGGASFLLHFLFITLGEMIFRLPIRGWFRGFYIQALRACLRLDHVLAFFPIMFVVCHGTNKTPGVQA